MRKLIHLSVIGVVSFLAVQASMASNKEDMQDAGKRPSNSTVTLDPETQAIVERTGRHTRIESLKVGTNTLIETINTGILKGKTQLPRPKLVRQNSTEELQAYEVLQKNLQEFATARLDRARSEKWEDTTNSDSSSALKVSIDPDITALIETMNKIATASPAPKEDESSTDDDSQKTSGAKQGNTGSPASPSDVKVDANDEGSSSETSEDSTDKVNAASEPAEELNEKDKNQKAPPKKAATPAAKPKAQPSPKADFELQWVDITDKKNGTPQKVQVHVFKGETKGKTFFYEGTEYNIPQAKAHGILKMNQSYGHLTGNQVRDMLAEKKQSKEKLHGKEKRREASKSIERGVKTLVKGKPRKNKD